MTPRWIDSFPSPGDAANTSRRPASILLDEEPRIDGRMNDDTLATVKSRDGHTINISFWIQDPPALSHFCVRCDKAPDAKPRDNGPDYWPQLQVVGAEGRFFLFRASFSSRYRRDEYFMYMAGVESGRSASLDPVPLPDGYRLPRADEFGIVPRGHGSCHYLVAALCLDRRGPAFDYGLHTYSSENGTWTSFRLPNPCPEVNKVVTSKVITLGEGVLGWVDFHHGMLVCDVRRLDEEVPDARYIPLPDPLPENCDELNASQPGPCTRRFRDLICCANGVIRFIEMEHRVIVTTEKPSDPSEKDHLYDGDLLIMSRKRKGVYEKPKQVRASDGWRVVTWTRTVSSSGWCRGCVVDVDDISIDDALYSSLLSGLTRGETVAGKLAFRGLCSAFPTLSTEGGDVLYLKTTVGKWYDPGGRMVALDLGRKRLKAHGA
jgi:hypothetical protein